MISIAAAITIPVTNAVKQENISRSLRATLMAASRCGPWSKRRAYLYRGGKVIEWNFGVAFADPFEGGFMRRRPQSQLITICGSFAPGVIVSLAHAGSNDQCEHFDDAYADHQHSKR